MAASAKTLNTVNVCGVNAFRIFAVRRVLSLCAVPLFFAACSTCLSGFSRAPALPPIARVCGSWSRRVCLVVSAAVSGARRVGERPSDSRSVRVVRDSPAGTASPPDFGLPLYDFVYIGSLPPNSQAAHLHSTPSGRRFKHPRVALIRRLSRAGRPPSLAAAPAGRPQHPSPMYYGLSVCGYPSMVEAVLEKLSSSNGSRVNFRTRTNQC